MLFHVCNEVLKRLKGHCLDGIVTGGVYATSRYMADDNVMISLFNFFLIILISVEINHSFVICLSILIDGHVCFISQLPDNPSYIRLVPDKNFRTITPTVFPVGM